MATMRGKSCSSSTGYVSCLKEEDEEEEEEDDVEEADEGGGEVEGILIRFHR